MWFSSSGIGTPVSNVEWTIVRKFVRNCKESRLYASRRNVFLPQNGSLMDWDDSVFGRSCVECIARKGQNCQCSISWPANSDTIRSWSQQWTLSEQWTEGSLGASYWYTLLTLFACVSLRVCRMLDTFLIFCCNNYRCCIHTWEISCGRTVNCKLWTRRAYGWLVSPFNAHKLNGNVLQWTLFNLCVCMART